MAELKKSCL